MSLGTVLAVSKSSFTSSTGNRNLKVAVPIRELEVKLQTILRGQGHNEEATKVIVDTLMFAELRNNNQGIVKLLAGALYPNPTATDIKIEMDSPVSCKLNGGQQIGMVVVKRSMDIAIAKAKQSGLCVVGCNN